MEMTDIVDFARRDGITDALTDLLRTGAQQLIATAVEAGFASYLAQFSDLRTDTGHAAVVRNGDHPARPFPNRHWPCECADTECPLKGRHTCDVPICLGAALRAPHQDVGSDLAVALPQRDFQWQNGSSTQGTTGA